MSFSSMPRSAMSYRSRRSRSRSSTRSTHSATSACFSSSAAGGVVVPPACWFDTSIEITTSSTITGMSALVHGEVLVEHLHRLHRDGVRGGVEVGHGPLDGIRAHQVPRDQGLVALVEELHVDVLRRDAQLLDAI